MKLAIKEKTHFYSFLFPLCYPAFFTCLVYVVMCVHVCVFELYTEGSKLSIRTLSCTVCTPSKCTNSGSILLLQSTLPPLQAADRSFLEDLLHYLRQQRKQLDDSRRLLERLEQSSIPSTTHIHVDTAESGTLPTPPHTHTGSQASHTQTPPRLSTQTTPTQSRHATTNTYSFHSERSSVPRTSSSPGTGHGKGASGMGNGSVSETYTYTGPPTSTESGGKAGKVDLSKLYEQCKSCLY